MHAPSAHDDEFEKVVELVMRASRALVAVASRSIAAVDDTVTLPQFRALVVLDARGGQCRVGDLARDLAIESSTATRLCDRLVRRDLARREIDPSHRRAVTVALSPSGRWLVDEVSNVRRREIASILSRVPPAQRASIAEGLAQFRDAAWLDDAWSTVPW